MLDEPFSNLDAVMRYRVINEIAALRSETDVTIVYSTHILSDVDKVAGRVVVLRAGVVGVDSPVNELGESVEKTFVDHYGTSEATRAPVSSAPRLVGPRPGARRVR